MMNDKELALFFCHSLVELTGSCPSDYCDWVHCPAEEFEVECGSEHFEAKDCWRAYFKKSENREEFLSRIGDD